MNVDAREQQLGRLVNELNDHVSGLNRLRKQADDLAPMLRFLADCFDSSITSIELRDVEAGNFTVEVTRDFKPAYDLPKTRTIRDTSDGRHNLYSFPAGDTVRDTAAQFIECVSRVKELTSELKKLGIDVPKIARERSALS